MEKAKIQAQKDKEKAKIQAQKDKEKAKIQAQKDKEKAKQEAAREVSSGVPGWSRRTWSAALGVGSFRRESRCDPVGCTKTELHTSHDYSHELRALFLVLFDLHATELRARGRRTLHRSESLTRNHAGSLRVGVRFRKLIS